MANENSLPGGFNVEDGGDYIGLGRTSMYELIKLGEIRVVKVGRRTIIPRSELDAFLARRMMASA